MTSFRHVEEGWMEFDAGRLGVEENGDNLGKVEFCRGEKGKLETGKVDYF